MMLSSFREEFLLDIVGSVGENRLFLPLKLYSPVLLKYNCQIKLYYT